MANLLVHINNKMQANFTFWDYGFLKVYGAIFGLILGANFPGFVYKFQWYFIGVFLIIMFRFLYLLFLKRVRP